jgi:peptidoglycan/LPS O-acetylase OafA/YrhL
MNRSTSLYLDLIRPIAAFCVLLGHVSFQNLSGGQLAVMSGAGKQAVDVFFVLSGFVIAHVYATRERDTRTYAISRAARIYSVAIPSLILTALVDAIGARANPAVYQGATQDLVPGLLIRTLFFVGEQWNAHRFPGCNGPYWSLGFEVWYYVAFGAFVFAPPRWRWLAVIAVLMFIGPKVASMFPAWLIGVASYYLCIAGRLSRPAGWMLYLSSMTGFAVFQMLPHSHLEQFRPMTMDLDRLRSLGEDYVVCLLFGAHLVGYSTVSTIFAPYLERYANTIQWIAGSTFTLYLAHLPIMHLVAAFNPFPASSPLTVWLLVTITPLACLAFAEISERRKGSWRTLVSRVVNLFVH